MKKELIRVEGASKIFRSRNWRGQNLTVEAVKEVDMVIYEGETVGLVGESGSGKTTLGRSILGLEALTAGDVFFEGTSLDSLEKSERKRRYQQMQIIFQDPYSALNPRMTALELVQEPLLNVPRKTAQDKAVAMLSLVGITGEDVHKLPRAFSGGQRQRIGIARALINEPRFVLCDEPTSALDVSIQAQILKLLAELQQKIGVTYLFISHDLNVIRHISDRIFVMYQGQVVEAGPAAAIFNDPQHAYTKRLLAAAPIPDPQKARKALKQWRGINGKAEIVVGNQLVPYANEHFVRI